MLLLWVDTNLNKVSIYCVHLTTQYSLERVGVSSLGDLDQGDGRSEGSEDGFELKAGV